ncbi:MAG: DUF2336 domain-containing protein [Magnetospiraceae bacterium]
MSTSDGLSKRDIERLLTDPSGETRAEMAAKVAAQYDVSRLTEAERTIAQEIFDIMVKDAEVRVRAALAQNIKENPDVPHHIAAALARDVDSVALPVLQFSEVLTDADLMEIIKSQSESKQVAVAGRKTVSETVSQALVESGGEAAVSTLVGNDGAELTDAAFSTVIERYPDNSKVHAAMVGRAKLPVRVSEQLVTVVSDRLKSVLVKRLELPDTLASDLLFQSRERAIIGLSTESADEDVEILVRQLRHNDRLTASIVLRALCVGDMRFFEAALAELAAIPLKNARRLIHDSGSLGLRSLYAKASLPEPFFPAARAAVDVARENDYDGEAHDRERYSRRMLERILTQYGDLGVEFESADLEYLLARMGQLQSDAIAS